MRLAEEMRTYQRRRDGWIAAGHEGCCAVIRGDEVLGIYPTLEEGVSAGYEAYGLDAPFMARRITREDVTARTKRPAVPVREVQS